MNKNLDKQLAQVFENDYPGYECFVEKVINLIFTGDDTYEAFQSAEDLMTDEKRRRKANESGILKILKVGEIDAPVPIEVFDITLKDDKDLQYNRVGIQSFIRSELFVFTNAFMLFHNENPEGKDWRFSFAYKDTTIKGMTPAKRYTYLFGKNHRARTASERFAKLADAEKDTQNLLNAFSVEALSKDFFNGYKEQYKAFCDFLFAHKDDREYFGPKFSQWEDKYLRDYVKKMMGRITFIYFLQRKGWMNNDLDYMQKAFENSTCKDDYLDSFLEPLFCGVLNTKPEERAELFKSLGWNLSLLDGWNDIPYLNGGLFERDEQDKPKSKFPALMFKNLFDFYSRYNFTIYENDPDDAEVGIDPEMLGHIFENLLEDNKDKGAFYTPKEIVQYMSRESIAQYLKTHADEALHTAIDELIKDGKVGEALQDKANATAIYRLLCDVKVCDPAIGSGAFPMGVLNVLYHARMLLYAFTRPTQGFSPAMVKREIIQNNIYGVDIEKGAVDIARLRFWLALVVDEEEPQPLPNLDYKIMCGNSLIHRFALDAPFQNVLKHYNKENKTNITLDDYRQWVYDYTNLSDHTQKDNFRQKIEEIKHAFRTELSTKEIDKLSKVRGKIEDLQSKDIFGNQKGSATEIKKLQGRLKDLEAQRDDINNNKLYENAFEWRFEFPALLDDDGNFTGFDVVIGNPPYISAPTQIANANLAEQRMILSKGKTYKSLYEKWDLYIPFIELGLQLNIRSGITSMIVPYPLTNQKYAKILRQMLVKENDLLELVDLNGTKIFENATVSNCIPFIKKADTKGKTWISKIDENLKISRVFVQSHLDLLQDEKNYVWNLTQEKRETNRHTDMHVLGDYCYISKGMVMHSEDGEFTKDDLISVTKDGIHCMQYVEAKDIERYNIRRVRYLEYYTDRCPQRLSRPTFPELYNCEKIVMNCLGGLNSTIGTKLTHNHSLYCAVLWHDLQGVINKSITTSIKKFSSISRIEMEKLSKTVDLRYLLGVMNSKYASVLLTNLRGGDYHIYPEHIRNIPIPSANKKQQQPIIDFVDKILAAKKEDPLANTSEMEQEIDLMIYKLYGLTYDELLVVDPETKITREEYKATII